MISFRSPGSIKTKIRMELDQSNGTRNTSEIKKMLGEFRNNMTQNKDKMNTTLGPVKDIDSFDRTINAAIGTFLQSLAQRK